MAEMSASALAACTPPGRYHVPASGAPALSFRELTGRVIYALRLPREHADGISGFLGCPLPTRPNTFERSQTATVLALGPDEWMLVGRADVPPGLAQAARRAGGALVDTAGGWTSIAATGPKIRDLLDKGCALDLRPHHFAPGQCARTLFMRVSMIMLAHARDEFELMVPASFAVWVWQALCGAAEEWGYEVLPPGEG